MTAAKRSGVPRPTKKAKFLIVFGTRSAEKGWRDLLATRRNAVVDAWDFPTRTPTERLPTDHQLKGELSVVTRGGRAFDQWQHELSNGARFWFYVDGQPPSIEVMTSG